MRPASTRTPVYGIDAVRFLAAVAVVLYHFSAKPFITPETSTLRFVLGEPRDVPPVTVWWGWIGVQVFFVISGAVISYSATRATPRGFFVSRVARLWPTMLICTILVSAFNLGWWDHGLLQEIGLAARSLLFWPSGPWVTGQIWTLPIEVIFYGLVWLLIVAGLEGKLEGAAWVLGLMSCDFWLMEAAGLIQARGPYAWLLLEHGIYFALGMVIMASGTRRLTGSRMLLAAICCVGAWLQVTSAAEHEGGGLYRPLLPYLIWLAASTFIWLSVAAREPIAQWVERKAGMAAGLRTIGLVTYPLYLVHVQPGGLLLASLLERGAPLWVAVLCSSGLAISLATVIALWIEPPVRRSVRPLIEAALDRMGFRRPVTTSSPS